MNWYLKVLKKYATFSGRAQRAEYWYFTLFSAIIIIILSVLDTITGLYNYETDLGLLSSIYALGILIPNIAVAVRRLHDIGKSGWWLLLILIPIIGVIVIFIFMVLDSKVDNIYGVNPKGNTTNFNDDSINQLVKLSELKEKGVLTQSEFDEKKKEILGQN